MTSLPATTPQEPVPALPASYVLDQWKRVRYIRLVALGLVVLAFVTYFNSLSTPFLFDDEPNIGGDTGIRELVLSNTGLLQGRRAVVRISLAINYAIDKQLADWQGDPEGGLNPAGYHLMNIFIHASAGLVLFGLVPVAMVWSEREGETTLSKIRVAPGGRGVLVVAGTVASGVIVDQLLHL